jgi:hypothetical protein
VYCPLGGRGLAAWCLMLLATVVQVTVPREASRIALPYLLAGVEQAEGGARVLAMDAGQGGQGQRHDSIFGPAEVTSAGPTSPLA